MNNIYIDYESFSEKRDLILDMLYLSVEGGRLHAEELVWVASRLYELTDNIKSKIEIFKEVRDEIDKERKEI